MPLRNISWELDVPVEPLVAYSGPGATEPVTVSEVFRKCADTHADRRALSIKKDGKWKTYSWANYYANSIAFAKGLLAIGHQPFDCVNVIGFNSPEWFFANQGTIAAGGVIAGIYTTNGPESCQYITEHSKAICVVVENELHLNKYLTILENDPESMPNLKSIVMWTGTIREDLDCRVPVSTFKEFCAVGLKKISTEAITERQQNQLPGHCCCLIYTSGTTGPPKAVMISHDNLAWTAQAVISRLGDITPNERIVTFLPLSHVAAQLIDIHCLPFVGVECFFADPDALKGSLVETLKEIKPTIFFGVPRVWEKIMEKMLQVGARTTGLKKMVAKWAKSKGSKSSRLAQYGKANTQQPCGFGVADSLVLSKVKQALGLENCRYAFSGAAPISNEVLQFFANFNVHVFELFGQSECTGPHSFNYPGSWKLGTIGHPLDGTSTRIDENTGEIQYRGRHIFMGYLYDEEKTKETVRNGWLCSGDVGKIDEDGFLSITGRIKELIITAGGENVPPVLIEDALKSELRAISNVMVIGDKRKFLTFLVSLRVEIDKETGVPSKTLDQISLEIAKEIGSTATTVAEASKCEKFNAYLSQGMKRANSKATSRAQCVQKFHIIAKDFSIAGGELTPTLKLKRSVVSKLYEQEIEAMYV